MRQIFFDIETTGFDYKIGNRMIEFGAVEVIDRRLTGKTLHFYCNPQGFEVEPGALNVHGITNNFLDDKPLFKDNVEEMIEFIRDTEIIAHNGIKFDIPFINWELGLLNKQNKWGVLENVVGKISDSLDLARTMHPLQKNNLDALCKRYFIKNDHRHFHGALLDSELLADVYLAMTGGQTNLSLHNSSLNDDSYENLDLSKIKLRKLSQEAFDITEHDNYLKKILKLEDNLW